jgi:hypothetical protein
MMAARSEARTGRSNTEIVGSNHTRGMERRADPPSKESYQLSSRFTSFRKINSETEQAKRRNSWKTMMMRMMNLKWKIMKIPNQDSRLHVQDSNPESLEWEAGLSTNQTQR